MASLPTPPMGTAIHAVRAGGGEGGVAVYKGAEGGNGPGSAFNREDAADRNERH
jgi:hypothetical protein